MNSPDLLALTVTVFGLAWWLGLYLLARDPADQALRFAGLGLVSYALGLAADLLSQAAPTPASSQLLARWGWPLLLLPALFWFGTLAYVLPESTMARRRLARPLRLFLIPGAILIYLLAGGTERVATIDDGGLQPAPLYPLFALVVIGLLVGALLMVLRAHRPNLQAGLGVIVLATIFFGLGTGLLLFPLAWLPRQVLALAIGGDLALLGGAIAGLDALDQGEALLPDFLRSSGYAGFTAVLFGGQVALVMVLATGATFPMVVLLLATVAAAIAVQTLADPLQAALDWLLFARLPRIRQARTEARAVARGATRGRETLDIDTLSEAQLTRLTRRA
ncbi:MAG: hypothetical protein R3300_07510, partial [Candidatus Promineifilaceae bacterium]|nr:hypothetical protein [Candidatus Promineifilaceae bacterium]